MTRRVIKKRIRYERDGVHLVGDGHAEIATNVGPNPPTHDRADARSIRGEEVSMGEQQFKQLTREELDRLAGEPLPERAAMSLVNANVAIPINLALAANVLSDNATAVANAVQQGTIGQST